MYVIVAFAIFSFGELSLLRYIVLSNFASLGTFLRRTMIIITTLFASHFIHWILIIPIRCFPVFFFLFYNPKRIYTRQQHMP